VLGIGPLSSFGLGLVFVNLFRFSNFCVFCGLASDYFVRMCCLL